MKKTLKITVIALTIGIPAIATAKGGSGGHTGGGHSGVRHSYSYSPGYGTGSKMESSHVNSYTKSNGTHVDQHNRSTRDDTKSNNWSTKGNVNPDTGKPGTKSAY
ncbi:hypothetical protein FEE59_13950 [Herbaspirillum sp. RU 5E]|nr:hypothetical protein [Herbaspirillum sp. RU 5E]